MTKKSFAKYWMAIWLGYLITLGIKQIVTNSIHMGFAYAWEALFALAVSLFSLYQATLWRRGLILFSIVLTSGYLINFYVSANSFVTEDRSVANSNSLRQKLSTMSAFGGGDSAATNQRTPYFRKWLIFGNAKAVSIDLRKTSGISGSNWYRSSKDIQVLNDNTDSTRFSFDSEQNGFIFKESTFDTTISDRTFRFTIQFDCTYLPSSQSTTYLRLGSDGIFEQIALDCQKSLQTRSVTWHVPTVVQSNILRVSLVNLPTSLDIYQFKLEEKGTNGWFELPPSLLQPYGIDVAISVGTRESNFSLAPKLINQTETLSTPEMSRFVNVVSVSVNTQDFAMYEAQNFKFLVDTTPVSVIAIPVISKRISAISHHPNFDAHSVALIAIFFLLTNRFRTVATVLISAFALVLGASRGAWLALYANYFGYLILKQRIKAIVFICIIGVIAASVIVKGNASNHFSITQVITGRTSNTMSRSEIWTYAYQAFLENPIKGSSEDFDTYLINKGVQLLQAPLHAHNFWLQQAFNHGIFGILGSLWLTVGLFALAIKEKYKRLERMLFLCCFLTLNLFDNTFFYSTVLIPFIVGINQFAHDKSRDH